METLTDSDPRKIGPYRLLYRLGAGGMGRVYLGLSRGNRAVAIKVIHPFLAVDPVFVASFRREVEAAKAVSGAYTAPVIAYGLDDPQPWLATAYVAGPSLADAIWFIGISNRQTCYLT
jgi:serine/threonine protein kinase